MSQTETPHNPTVDQLQKLHRRRMATFGSIILIAGIAIGAASTVILLPRPKPFAAGPDPTWLSRMMADRLERVLDLTAEQKEKTSLIFTTAFQKIREAQEDAKPIIDAAIKEMNEDISDVLTADQNTKWQRDIEEFKNKFRDRWRRGGRRPGEGGPGSGRRRGPGDPNRSRKGSSWRSEDPNRPHRGPGPFGPGFRPDDPNRPREDFDRYRRGGGSFGRRPRPEGPNRPPQDPMIHEPMPDQMRPGQ